MSFNGINVNHIRGGARTYPPTSLVGCVCHPLPERGRWHFRFGSSCGCVRIGVLSVYTAAIALAPAARLTWQVV